MSGTIRDNLRLGKLNATDEEMQAALHTSCADFVMELPQGLDTVCSEQGGGLSEGQAQRIAIARSLLRNRSIMLLMRLRVHWIQKPSVNSFRISWLRMIRPLSSSRIALP